MHPLILYTPTLDALHVDLYSLSKQVKPQLY